MLSQSDNLSLWATKFHTVFTEFEDKKDYFEDDEVQQIFIHIYRKRCKDSLDPLYDANR